WAFASCTTSIGVLSSEVFLGQTGSRTMFVIETDSGINIRNHSYFRKEEEVLLLPATQFKIIDRLPQGNGLHFIQLQEMHPPVALLQPVTIGRSYSNAQNSILVNIYFVLERTYSDNSRYRGHFKGGKRHGTGTYEYANGEKYQGEWINDQTNGKGIRTFPSGNRYDGEEKNGKRHGYGVNYWANGEKYEGYWANDKMNGSGKYFWPTNVQYEGEYRNDKKHGQGTLRCANGRVIQGLWDNDQFKGSSFHYTENKKGFWRNLLGFVKI
ncbi:unnamed protein product, partial [Adineta ricciae]